MSVKDITECCSNIGLNAIGVTIAKEKLDVMPLPAIIYWRNSHFVVLYKVHNNKYYVADPSQGKIKYNETEFLKNWLLLGKYRGIAIVIEPSSSIRIERCDENNSFTNFLFYLKEYFHQHSKGMAFTIIATLFIMLCDFSLPLLLRKTVDDGIALKNINTVITMLLFQLFISLGSIMATSIMNLLLTKIGLDVNVEMIESFLKNLAKFPLSFFDRKVSSDFIQKMNDISRIKDFLLTYPSSILVMILNMIVFSSLLLHYSVSVFLCFMIFSIFEILWNALFLNRRKVLDNAVFTDSSENRNHAYELAYGMADLKVNNGEYNKIRKWSKTQDALNKDSIDISKLNLVQGGGLSILSRLKTLIITGISAFSVINGNMTIGIMMTLGYIIGRLEQPFNTFSTTIEALQEALLSYQRIEEIVNPSRLQIGGQKQFRNSSIEFKHVWFKYAGSSSPYVIKDLTIEIEEGKTTAIVGESGSGKTTLIKLMLGFYIPQKGELLLGRSPVTDVDNEKWLKHCGAVMQDGKIFTDTIIDNITMSDDNVDANRALSLLRSVGLYDFVKKLPMGINTRIGVSGVELSGGQKQRLLIARALYKNPDILFLDEATSSLDANNEKLIVNNINNLVRGKTIIVAAHRLSTIMNADKILFIEDGRIVESGNHEELLKLKGRYWKLVKNQMRCPR